MCWLSVVNDALSSVVSPLAFRIEFHLTAAYTRFLKSSRNGNIICSLLQVLLSFSSGWISFLFRMTSYLLVIFLTCRTFVTCILWVLPLTFWSIQSILYKYQLVPDEIKLLLRKLNLCCNLVIRSHQFISMTYFSLSRRR